MLATKTTSTPSSSNSIPVSGSTTLTWDINELEIIINDTEALKKCGVNKATVAFRLAYLYSVLGNKVKAKEWLIWVEDNSDEPDGSPFKVLIAGFTQDIEGNKTKARDLYYQANNLYRSSAGPVAA